MSHMTFIETSVRPRPALLRPAALPAPGDHRAWLAYWADELRNSLSRVTPTTPAGQPWDFAVEHAVRSAKMVHYHGSKVLRWRDAR